MFALLLGARLAAAAPLAVSNSAAGVQAVPLELPDSNPGDPIFAAAQAANCWRQGAFEVWVLRGNCQIRQGADTARSDEAVLWIDHADPRTQQRSKVITYLEGHVTIQRPRHGQTLQLADQARFGRLYTAGTVLVQAARVAGQPDVLPAVYQHGMDRRRPDSPDVLHRGDVEPAQFAAGLRPATPGHPATPAIGAPLPPGMRRIRVFPRGDVPVQAQWFPDPQTRQWVAVIDSGVNMIVDGLPGIGAIDVSTDRLVIWTNSDRVPDLTGQASQSQDVPLEVYMEGNIVFRQGDRIINARSMYYDVRNHVGTVLNADMLTPVPKYEGLLRLHADVLQETSRDHFYAQQAYFTSSRMGAPTYRIQANEASFEDIQRPVVDPYSGQPLADPAGHLAVEHERHGTANNNVVFIEDIPVFYWPVLATDFNESDFYLRRIQYKNDTVFGQQFLSDWNMYQLLGIHKPPAGTDWNLSLDYLSMRGFGYGTTYQYRVDSLFGIPGHTSGLFDYWGIHDTGYDNLGTDRSHLQPETENRYRLLWQHREELPDGFQVTAEVGKVSDRNFLEEYYKHEWDELKDQSTDVELKQYYHNMSWSLLASGHLDTFVTETEWLPRFDHFWLGQSLLDDNLTWYEHSSAAYARFRVADPPSNPNDQPFDYLPWERRSTQGERLLTRNELDWPLQAGPVKVVPYFLGELGRWGEDLDGSPLNRAYYQAGVRATLPMWNVDPTVQSSLWNVHGLAHKVEFDLEFWNSQTNEPMTKLPLYDPLNDWSTEAFQRRFLHNTFGEPSPYPPGPPLPGYPPGQFDERFYALRTGMAGSVTAPSMEIADNLTALRAGVHQRWQTKRGFPENMHIIDWIELDTNVTLFPNPDRDNFGAVAGLFDYNFRWHVGDRLTLVSEGVFDFFDQGSSVASVGAYLTRPPRGSIYAGFRLLDGPIHNDIFIFSYSYLMSPKWISTFGLTVDLADTHNVGNFMRITRVGESLLVSAGFNVDPTRNTTGVSVMVEPRFLPKTQLGQVGGARIPAAGAYGLE
jgi:hypothetical protein